MLYLTNLLVPKSFNEIKEPIAYLFATIATTSIKKNKYNFYLYKRARLAHIKAYVSFFVLIIFLLSCTRIIPKEYQGMILIPAGTFTMGFDTQDETEKWGDRDEEPIHQVFISRYWIDRYEVTAFDFSNFLNQNKEKALNYFETGDAVTIDRINGFYQSRSGLDKYPANHISWYGANAYCRSMGKRLPTEAEWEKAARGIDGRIFPWGNTLPNKRIVTFRRKFSQLGLNVMEPVDSLPEGRSPYSLHHMAGNVWEWVNDWYDPNYYKHSPERDPQGPQNGTSKVMRGGNWYYKAYYLRVTYRFNDRPDTFKVWQGFRCAKNAD